MKTSIPLLQRSFEALLYVPAGKHLWPEVTPTQNCLQSKFNGIIQLKLFLPLSGYSKAGGCFCCCSLLLFNENINYKPALFLYKILQELRKCCMLSFLVEIIYFIIMGSTIVFSYFSKGSVLGLLIPREDRIVTQE